MSMYEMKELERWEREDTEKRTSLIKSQSILTTSAA